MLFLTVLSWLPHQQFLNKRLTNFKTQCVFPIDKGIYSSFTFCLRDYTHAHIIQNTKIGYQIYLSCVTLWFIDSYTCDASVNSLFPVAVSCKGPRCPTETHRYTAVRSDNRLRANGKEWTASLHVDLWTIVLPEGSYRSTLWHNSFRQTQARPCSGIQIPV